MGIDIDQLRADLAKEFQKFKKPEIARVSGLSSGAIYNISHQVETVTVPTLLTAKLALNHLGSDIKFVKAGDNAREILKEAPSDNTDEKFFKYNVGDRFKNTDGRVTQVKMVDQEDPIYPYGCTKSLFWYSDEELDHFTRLPRKDQEPQQESKSVLSLQEENEALRKKLKSVLNTVENARGVIETAEMIGQEDFNANS